MTVESESVRERPSAALVISLIALFASLGGFAWAAATINSNDVINDSLKSVDLRDGKGVKGADVVPDSLSGAAIDESSLGEVPSAASADTAADADTLDSIDSTGFVAGGGQRVSVGTTLGISESDQDVLHVGGVVQLVYLCPPDPANTNGQWRIVNQTAGSANVWIDDGSDDPLHNLQPANNFNFTQPTAHGGELLIVQMKSMGNQVVTLWLTSVHTASGCQVAVQGVHSP